MTAEEIRGATSREDVSIFPIAIPLLAGPGAITTVILVIRVGTAPELKMMVILAILLTFTLSCITFRFANRINKIMEVTGSLVITWVMGLLLGAIPVSFVSIGAWNLYRSVVYTVPVVASTFKDEDI